MNVDTRLHVEAWRTSTYARSVAASWGLMEKKTFSASWSIYGGFREAE
jgi:hypothetical protein